ALQQALSTQPIAPSPEPTHKEFIDAARKAASAFDAQRGGLQGAPKFPNAPILNMLWRAGAQAPDLRKPVLQTLRQMALGGIHDHIGGGFARYSVDPLWLVPHFEKMLYDNAQLLELYALAAQYTGESIYRDAAHGIVAWLTREMTLPNGAFASSLDADSEGHEGRSYVWKRSEIESNLSPDDADLFSRSFDITEEGNFEGANIPNRLAESAHTAQEEARVEDIKRILLAARMRRVQPERDDKVLADWNGLMIAALARASLLLDEPSWIPKAHNAYRFIRTHMCPAGRLAHSWRGQVGISPAFALDHAAMALAALALAEAAQDAAPGLVAEAISDMGTLLSHYSGPDSKVIAMTSDLGEPLLVRPRPTHDEATPNANGVALEALYRCAHMAMDDRLAAHADELIAALAGSMRTQSLAHASHWSALDLRLNAAQILVTGEEPSELATAAAAVPFPNRILAGLPSGVAPPPGHPAHATFKTTAGPTAYVCVGMRCSLPIQDPTQIADAVASLRG
ncbi:MAG: thioredoxin domain-containing protein, partial [Beijerinckiaceae bacterium]